MTTNTYITIKDNEGKIRPTAFLWRDDKNLKYSEPEIKKYMTKATKDGITLVRVRIDVVENITLEDIPKY